MDEIDFEILSILCEDARVPFKKIAAEIGISTETVLRRFKKLQEEGVVLGSSVILSSEACGFKELVGFFIKTKSGVSITTVKDRLAEVSQINSIWQEWGAYDFYAEAFLRDLSEIHEVLDNIRKIKGITAVATMVYKDRDWPIPFEIPFPALCPWLSPKASQKRQAPFEKRH